MRNEFYQLMEKGTRFLRNEKQKIIFYKSSVLNNSLYAKQKRNLGVMELYKVRFPNIPASHFSIIPGNA